MQKAHSAVPVAIMGAPPNSKHLKRHSKPFGCTHDGCNKIFGPKSDWKRHENSQHHQLECWKCDIRCLTTPPEAAADTPYICGKCFFRKADFVKHLKMVHGNADGWVVGPADQALATNGGEQIPTPITLTGFDYIAWHFEKDNLRVKDTWMRLEEPFDDDEKAPWGKEYRGE